MRDPIALFTSDWHLRKRGSWLHHPNLRGDAEYGLAQISELVENLRPNALLIGGDTFETPEQTANPLREARHLVEKAAACCCKTYFVRGQHECSYPPLLSAICTFAVSLHKQYIELAPDFRLCGLDYCNPADVRTELANLPAHANVLLTHQVWKDFMGEQRGDAELAWVPPEIRTILTGDYHRAFEERIQDRLVISPGPLCLQKLDEPPRKCVYVLFDSDVYTQIELRSRAVFHQTIQTEEELTAFLDDWMQHKARTPQVDVPALIGTNILEISFRVDIPNAKERIEKHLRDQVHLFFTLIMPPEETQAIAVLNPEIVTNGMEGCLREYYPDPPDVLNDAIQLWRASDADVEIDRIFADAST